jgi:hypothetical protein
VKDGLSGAESTAPVQRPKTTNRLGERASIRSLISEAILNPDLAGSARPATFSTSTER